MAHTSNNSTENILPAQGSTEKLNGFNDLESSKKSRKINPLCKNIYPS